MARLVNNHQYAIQVEEGIKIKTDGLGSNNIEEAAESNIVGVTENATAYAACAELLKDYKQQLDIDLSRIRGLGICFFEMDHDGINL